MVVEHVAVSGVGTDCCMEQRSYVRLHLRCPIMFSWKFNHELCFGRGETHDISVSGFLVVSKDGLPPEGSVLRCEVQLGSLGPDGADMVMRTVGRVRRTEPFEDPGAAAFAVQCRKVVIELDS